MVKRSYDGLALDCTEQWIGERPYRGSGETVNGSSAEDVGEEKTVGLPNVAAARAKRSPEPLDEDVETAEEGLRLQLIKLALTEPNSVFFGSACFQESRNSITECHYRFSTQRAQGGLSW